MTTSSDLDPPRLLDDPAFPEMARALVAERSVAVSDVADAAALKSRLLANIAAGAVPSALSVTAATTSWTAKALPIVLAGVVGVGAGIGGTLAALGDASPRAREPAAPSQVAIAQSEPATTSTPSPARSVAGMPSNLAPAQSEAGKPFTRANASSDAATPPKPATAQSEPATTSKPFTAQNEAASPPAKSSLVDENRRYERAETALREGRASVAVDELKAYLRAYPNGSLRDEVRLTLLEAHLRSEMFSEARDLGRALSVDEDLRDRRREIFRVLAQAELALHECDQARRDLRAAGSSSTAIDDAVSRCQNDRDAR